MNLLLLILAFIVIIIYSLGLLIILIYSLFQLNLLWNKNAKKQKLTDIKFDPKQLNPLPFVTIQLPIYNELYVIKRLLNCIEKIQYPPDKLEIQVLDDSTDETSLLAKKTVADLKKKGLNISHITRKNRTGFKAGALKNGLKFAKGEFIAIFDADFLPKPNWIIKTIPYFKNKKMGLVQTCWAHLNKNYSLLTRIQAFALDIHFLLEQPGRNKKNFFINFNGTAGIWRKKCILDAGNWEGDTLTEDLDLSYRAQLKNWKILFLENVKTLAELPTNIAAIKSQQFRWNKGGAENFQKLFLKVIKSKTISLKIKTQAVFHLLNSTMFLNVFSLAILSVPILYIKNQWEQTSVYFFFTSFFVISTLILFLAYWSVYKKANGNSFVNFIDYIKTFFSFYAIAMGLSFHISIAVIQGHLRKKTDFMRTPKLNVTSQTPAIKKNKYSLKINTKKGIAEGVLAIYFLFGLYSAFVVGENGDFGLFFFHLLLFLGFFFVFIHSFFFQKK